MRNQKWHWPSSLFMIMHEYVLLTLDIHFIHNSLLLCIVHDVVKVFKLENLHKLMKNP